MKKWDRCFLASAHRYRFGRCLGAFDLRSPHPVRAQGFELIERIVEPEAPEPSSTTFSSVSVIRKFAALPAGLRP